VIFLDIGESKRFEPFRRESEFVLFDAGTQVMNFDVLENIAFFPLGKRVDSFGLGINRPTRTNHCPALYGIVNGLARNDPVDSKMIPGVIPAVGNFQYRHRVIRLREIAVFEKVGCIKMRNAKYFLSKFVFVVRQRFFLKFKTFDVIHETDLKVLEILRTQVECNDTILSCRKHDDSVVSDTSGGFDNIIKS